MKSKLKIALFCALASCFAASRAAAPSGYYTPCEGFHGKKLLEALHDVIGNHSTISYSGLWGLYKESDIDENGKIWDMYSTKRWQPGGEQCGSYSAVGDCYNREHSFPKSWFDDASPMVSDAFHIYPTDGKVNGQRSNYPYGECASGTTLPSSGGVKALGKLGVCTFPGYTGTVFEPDDEYKGDFARSYFYMATCYNDRISSWNSDMLAHNSYPAFTSWATDLLLKWHRQDPVSQKEIDRNEAVYAAQRNRNPFIDHPELAEHIWGDKTGEGWADGPSAPAIILPVDGSYVDLGSTVAGINRTHVMTVRGVNLESNATVKITGDGFSVTPQTLGKSGVCSAEGAAITVSFKSSEEGAHDGMLTVTAGTLTSTVTLYATVVDRLPAGPASAVDDESFDAAWTYVGDADADGMYTLDVRCGGASLAGYPRRVEAAAESYSVTGLEPSTQYTYTLASQNLASDAVGVTTLAPQPGIELVYDGVLSLVANEGEPSEAVELLVEAKNIEGDITVAVSAPFEVSTDKSSWAQSCLLGTDEDRFYLRVNAPAAGEYVSGISLSAGTFINDDALCTASVVSSRGFVETFDVEKTVDDYGKHYQQGTGCQWYFTDAGIWGAEGCDDTKGVRFGKTASSQIEMTEDWPSGFGTVTFYAAKWSGDANPTIAVEYSTDGGENWLPAGSTTLTSADFNKLTYTVNAAGSVRLRIRQTAGKRLIVDNIEATNYTMSVADATIGANSWDAFCRGGELVVEAAETVNFTVYAIDGTEVLCRRITPGISTFRLDKGLYIVSAADHARRVLIK